MPIADNDTSTRLQQQVEQAISAKEPLFIHGGKTKLFYGNPVDAKPLDVSSHTGIVSYEPTELCITVRAGTRLSDLEDLLAENQQLLPFEPPHFFDINQAGDNTTIGGVIAAGIAGPRRAYSGSVRDAILGVQIINGNGEIVNFGGQVMKNVAGYDLSRLMVRSQGTLGVLLAISIRLLPKPENDVTVYFKATQEQALDTFHKLKIQQLPITGTAWYNNRGYLRLSASMDIIEASKRLIDSEITMESNDFWQSIRDHRHHFFGRTDRPLWRLSLPPASKVISRFENEQLIEWGGAQRWIHSNAPPNIIHSVANSRNGYATLFRGNIPETPRFPILEPALLKLHKSLKNKMDPHNIFNPNRIYQGL